MRRILFVLGLGICLFAGWQAVEAWQFHSEMTQAEQEIRAKQFSVAGARLSGLAKRWPGRGDVELSLGRCEAEQGRFAAALAAWKRVPAHAEQAPSANLLAAKLALDHGRFADAEEALNRLRTDPLQNEPRSLRDQLSLYTGRLDEIRKLLRLEWDRGRGHTGTLRKLWLLDGEALPVNAIRDVLDRAERESPDDDRVWLGRAILATQAGRFDEADGWFKKCLERRPEDPDVWRARLDWALDQDKLDQVAQILPHLPADRLSHVQVLDLRARFAAYQGEAEAERAALTKLLALEPGDQLAIERLAALTAKAGDGERAAELRRRKADLDRARYEYRKLLVPTETPPDLRELARTAEALGRRFEARGWWTLWAQQGGDTEEARAAIARIGRDEPLMKSDGKTAADLLADVLPRPNQKHSASRSELSRLLIPQFRDDAEKAGLKFVYNNGSSSLRRLPETMGGGVGLIDYDGDGWLDVYAVQGGSFPPQANVPRDGDRLFRNKRDGTFEDVTTATGISGFARGFGHGVTVGDFDNDGHPDLFITRWRSYALYRNRGNGTFEDATEATGLGGNRDWPTSAVFADLDNDGDLDLYVCHYLVWDPERSEPCLDSQKEKYVYCVPHSFPALPDHVFRNDHGKFTDVTAEAGIVDHDGRGLGVIAVDVDDDGRLDLFVANDMTANFLFKNQGGFRFREEGAEDGVATNASGGYQAGMGVAAGDLDGDGLVDLAVTNFYGESTTLYQNLGNGQFADHTAAVGLAAPSRFLLGFGIAFLDANNDGRLDLTTANGHVNDLRPAIPSAMPAELLLGINNGRLEDVSDRAGPPWQVPRLGRGLALGDLDNDGRLDTLILSQNSPLAYFHNEGASAPSHFATFLLEGTASNRDAVGARLTLTAGGQRQVTQRYGGGSFLSANDPRIHFGLGTATRIDSLEVRWPSGKVDLYKDIPADAAYHLREGDAEPKPLKGFIKP